MTRRVAVKSLILLGLMCAAMWSFSAPKKTTPYASALESVTVKTAHAAQCGFKCSAFQHAICLTAPPNKACSNNGTYCLTLGCDE